MPITLTSRQAVPNLETSFGPFQRQSWCLAVWWENVKFVSLSSSRHPILLDKNHHLTRLIVVDAHLCVMHDGVKETLTELRSEYWLVRGRQYVRKVIHRCVVCKKHEGKHCRPNPSPPLPEHRVRQTRPFQTTGVDFASPLFVKTSNGTSTGTSKVWLCLYTCSSTRVVHLDLVIDMTTTTFIRSFRRFSAR